MGTTDSPVAEISGSDLHAISESELRAKIDQLIQETKQYEATH